MAVKKKKKKKKFGKSVFSGSKSRELSPFRPKHVEKQPPCSHVCPSGNRVREFVTTIAQAQRLGKSTEQAFEEAWRIYTDTSPFPAVSGCVCPHPCQSKCNRKDHDGSVEINQIEREIGDFGLQQNLKLKTLSDETRPEKIAVLGGGPAEFSAAYQLAGRGYRVTVFEATDKPLRWGIPHDRLPADILDGEIQKILDLGVELNCDAPIGTEISLNDLSGQYQAVLVSTADKKGLGLQVEGTYAVGDDTVRPASVTTAVGRGRRTAEALDRKLRGEEEPSTQEMPPVKTDRLRLDHFEKSAPAAEISSQEQVIHQTRRCMSCGYCFDCEKCWLYCQDQAIIKPMKKGVIYSFKMENCTGCKKCAEECPCGFIDMV